MPRTLSILILAVLLSGCVSTYIKSRAGVGSEIRSVVVVAGPPDHWFDVSDNRRAFQWRMGRDCFVTYFAVKQGRAWVVESIQDPAYAIC